MPDHEEALRAIRRAVTGISVPPEELDRAIEHVAVCEVCRARFEDERTAACERVEEVLPNAALLLREGGDPAGEGPEVAHHLEECERCTAIVAELAATPQEMADVADEPVDADELFERALVAGLTDPDEVLRERSASQLGKRGRVGAMALAVLADTAGEDPAERVRRAALTALDELDEEVSIPQRLIEAWSESPVEGAEFIGGVLARLAADRPPNHRGVTELIATERRQAGELYLTGKYEIVGRLAEEQGRLWLTLDRLPPALERTRPIVALPDTLRSGAGSVAWEGNEPGLVRSEEQVTGGSLRLSLGRIAKSGVAEREKSLRHLFLLTPEIKRNQAD